jgi:hypothetical protein
MNTSRVPLALTETDLEQATRFERGLFDRAWDAGASHGACCASKPEESVCSGGTAESAR